MALDNGANDYVTKPFDIAELLARLCASTRIYKLESGQAADQSTFVSGRLKIDYVARIIELDGEPVKLTRKEYDILRLLTRNAGKVLTRDFLLREVWGPAQAEADQAQYLRVHIGNLRQKLKDDSAKPSFILTEPGVGYRFIA